MNWNVKKSVLVIADGHYYIDDDNNCYVDSVFDYCFYSRYLQSFDIVFAIVRAKRIRMANERMKLASGNNVLFLPIDESDGVVKKLLNRQKNKKIINKYLRDIHFDMAIFRVPGVVSNLVYSLWNKNKPYALEVVVDPWMYFSPGTIKMVYRPFVRIVWTMALKKMCRESYNISYVTEQYLQKKYPCKKKNSFLTFYSSVELADDSFGDPRIYSQKQKYIISHVANSFSSYGKGHIILMKALKIVLAKGYDVDVLFVGDGKLRSVFEKKAKRYGISKHVCFLGRVSSGMEVRNIIKKSDLFVFPTKGEGLPRVLLEAMAEGIPSLSTPICGIPEVLSKEFLVEFKNYKGFAQKIIEFINNPSILNKCSIDNIQTAKKYSSSILNNRRKEFYDHLKDYSLGDYKQ